MFDLKDYLPGKHRLITSFIVREIIYCAKNLFLMLPLYSFLVMVTSLIF